MNKSAYELGFETGYVKEAGALKQWITDPKGAFNNLSRGASSVASTVGNKLKNMPTRITNAARNAAGNFRLGANAVQSKLAPAMQRADSMMGGPVPAAMNALRRSRPIPPTPAPAVPGVPQNTLGAKGYLEQLARVRPQGPASAQSVELTPQQRQRALQDSELQRMSQQALRDIQDYRNRDPQAILDARTQNPYATNTAPTAAPVPMNALSGAGMGALTQGTADRLNQLKLKQLAVPTSPSFQKMFQQAMSSNLGKNWFRR